MEFVATEDTFGESGTPSQLMKKYGLDKEAIIRKVLILKTKINFTLNYETNNINIFIFLISFKSFGQLNYGIKAGISLNASGDITSASSDLSSLALINENKNGYFWRIRIIKAAFFVFAS